MAWPAWVPRWLPSETHAIEYDKGRVGVLQVLLHALSHPNLPV